MASTTPRPIKRPPKRAFSQTSKQTRAGVSVMGKRTFAPMLKTATSIGAVGGVARADHEQGFGFVRGLLALGALQVDGLSA